MREKKRDEKAKRKAEKDKEREVNKAKRDEERAKKKAAKEEEKKKRKIEKDQKNETKKAEKDKKNAERKKKRELKRLNKQNKSGSPDENETESDDESEEYSDTDECTENENEDNEEEKITSDDKKKEISKRKIPNKKVLAGKAKMSTVNEKSKNKVKAKGNDNKLNNSVNGNNKTKESSRSIKDKDISKASKDKEKTSVKDKQDKKKSRKRYSDSDDFSDGSGTDYYEDWNPDAEDNPDTNVIRVNVKDKNKTPEHNDKRDKSSKTTKEMKGKDSRKANKNKGDENNQNGSKRSRSNRNSEKDTDTTELTSMKKGKTRKKRRKQKGNSENADEYDSDDSDNYDSEYSDECDSDDNDSDDYDSDEYDSEDYDSEDYDSDCEDYDSEDSDSAAKRNKKSKKKEKKTGFFGRLLGNLNMSNGVNNSKKANESSAGGKSNGFGDWDSEEEYNGNEQDFQANKVGRRSGLNGSGFGRSGYPGRTNNNNNKKSIFLKGNNNTTTDFGDWASDDDNDTFVNKGHNNEHLNSYARGNNMRNDDKQHLSGVNNGLFPMNQNNENGAHYHGKEAIPKNQNKYDDTLMPHNFTSTNLNPYDNKNGTSYNKESSTSHANQYPPPFAGNYEPGNRYPDGDNMQKTKPDERGKFNALFKVNSRRRKDAKATRANQNDQGNHGIGQSAATSSQKNNYGDGDDIFSTNNRAYTPDKETKPSQHESQNKYSLPISDLKESSNNSQNAMNQNGQFGNIDKVKNDRTQHRMNLEKDRPFERNINATNGSKSDINNRLQNDAYNGDSNENDNNFNKNRPFAGNNRSENLDKTIGDKSSKTDDGTFGTNLNAPFPNNFHNATANAAANNALDSREHSNAYANAPVGTFHNRYPGENYNGQSSNEASSLPNAPNMHRHNAFGAGGNHLNNGNKSRKLVSFRNNVPEIAGRGNIKGTNQRKNDGQNNHESNIEGTNGVGVGHNYNGGNNPRSQDLSTGPNYNGDTYPAMNGFPSGLNNNRGIMPGTNGLPARPNSNGINNPGSDRITSGTNKNRGTKTISNQLPSGQNNNGVTNPGAYALPTTGSHGQPTGTGTRNSGNNPVGNRLTAGPIYNAGNHPITGGLHPESNNSGAGKNGRINADTNGLPSNRNGLPTGPKNNGGINPNTSELHSGPNTDNNGNNNPLMNGIPNIGINYPGKYDLPTGNKYDGSNNPGSNVFPTGPNSNGDINPAGNRNNHNRGSNLPANGLPIGPSYNGDINPRRNGLPAEPNNNGGKNAGAGGLPTRPGYNGFNNAGPNKLPSDPKNNTDMSPKTKGLPAGPNSLRPGPSDGANAPTDSGENHDDFTSDADIVLPNNDNNRQLRSPVGRFINKPAWNNTKPDNSSTEKRKGSKTPVKELMKTPRRVSLPEPEPVFETDRLAKKFPFLNAGDSAKNDAKDDKPSDGMRKNQSDSNLNKLFGKGKPSGGLSKISSDPNITTKEKDDKNVSSINPDTRDKIFYGFGVGRWRLAAAKWLNTWKMKRRPVKTGESSWD